jgi:hypothetical protein
MIDKTPFDIIINQISNDFLRLFSIFYIVLLELFINFNQYSHLKYKGMIFQKIFQIKFLN